MRKIVLITLLGISIFFTSCNKKTDDANSISSNNNAVLSDDSALTASVPPSSEAQADDATTSVPDVEFNEMSTDGDLDAYDFETAYALCIQAITDYQYAKANGTEMNFEKYMNNAALIDYKRRELTAPRGARGGLDSNNEVNATGLWEFQFQRKFEKPRIYMKIAFGYKHGSYSSYSGTDFFVENDAGRLIISEWYVDGKDSFDLQCRNVRDVKNADIYWNDYDADALQKTVDAHIAKLEELSKEW